MTAPIFPPKAALAAILEGLARRLPEQMGPLMKADRFAEDVQALARLAHAEHRQAALDAMAPEEAQWMADRLMQRWARLGSVEVGPAVALVGPTPLWLGQAPQACTLRLATLGVDEILRVRWAGPGVIGRGEQATWQLTEPRQPAALPSAQVEVRARGQRHLLRAKLSITLLEGTPPDDPPQEGAPT